MAQFDHICDPMENYLLNSSFLLGNNVQQEPFPLAFSSSGISSSTCSSSISSIDDFDYLNQSLSTDMSAIVYDGGLPSYSLTENDMLGYLFMPTPTPTICSLVPEALSIKMELEDTCYFSQQQFQVPEQPFFGNNHQSQSNSQQFPSSPESTFSISSPHKVQNQKPQPQSPQKMFPCSYCNRSFARKYDATRHTRIHTGIKPYSCPCCNMGFSRSDARIRHFRAEFNCRDGPAIIQHRNHLQRRTTATQNNVCHL